MKQILVTPDEAVEAAREVNVECANFAHDVYRAYMEACKHDQTMIEEFALAAVFEAGRLQGIREK